MKSGCAITLITLKSRREARLGTGREIGYDEGQSTTMSVPIHEGHALLYAILQFDLADRGLTEHTMKNVRNRLHNRCGRQ